MALYVFGDECGHSNILKPDPNWPIFVFAATVCRSKRYFDEIAPAFQRLKKRHFDGGEPVFRSYKIRGSEAEFECLRREGCWEKFSSDLRDTVAKAPFVVLASAIRVNDHIVQYATPDDPYQLSLKFILERSLMLVRETGDKRVRFIMESRNSRHDKELRDRFDYIIEHGTAYKSSARFKDANYTIEFVPKNRNIIGTQISDLMAYPIARHVLKPPYRAYPDVEQKIYRGPEWMKYYNKDRPPGWIYGLKVFP